MGDIQRFCPVFQQFGRTPGDDGHLDTRGFQAADAIAVTDVEGFQLFTVITHVDQAV
ncbi:hypothetical protein D3C75_1258380 [compost metagenome]